LVVDHDEIGSAHHAGLIGRDQFQVDIHLLHRAQVARQLGLHLQQQSARCDHVTRRRTRRHDQVAFLQLGVAGGGLAELGVLRDGQQVSRRLGQRDQFLTAVSVVGWVVASSSRMTRKRASAVRMRCSPMVLSFPLGWPVRP
jgi:hypothetical protein